MANHPLARKNGIRLPEGAAGFAALTLVLLAAFYLLPALEPEPTEKGLFFTVGFLAIWRYSWGLINLVRSVIYKEIVFPRWRGIASANEDALMPSKIYLLMTSYKISSDVSIRAIRALIEEAVACGIPTTIVASVVEKQDEHLFTTIFRGCSPPESVVLRIVRLPGTGKRDGLADGFKAISRDMPPQDALVAVIDGDTVLLPGTLRKCAPFFKMRPKLGALTTDEFCAVTGSPLMRDWYDMRFAQRHMYMSSISLSRRVMTLTGRMSMFRANIVTHPDFIAHIREDFLDHHRLGRFRFLTGDDKSSLYWVMARGYEQIYIPDAAILTLEDPPATGFFNYSTQLMLRWFGNMLRTNARIVGLGLSSMPLFVWWSFIDQRISMWTTLSGPVFAAMLSLKYGPVIFAYYALWVIFTRWVMSLVLLTTRPKLNWRYPFLLYYNHIYGSLLKTWALFRLDRQSWTRQKTKLKRNVSPGWTLWNRWSSHAVHAVALCLLVLAVGVMSETLVMPHAILRQIVGTEAHPWLP